MLFQKWLNSTGMPWATLLTTQTPMILQDWRQEKSEKTGKAGRTEALLDTRRAPKSSETFPSYTAKTHRLTQTCNDDNNVVSLSACVCLIRHQRVGIHKITVCWTFATISQYLWVFWLSVGLFAFPTQCSNGYMLMSLCFRSMTAYQ